MAERKRSEEEKAKAEEEARAMRGQLADSLDSLAEKELDQVQSPIHREEAIDNALITRPA